LSFWFFAIFDGFFIGDVGFFVGPVDFFSVSTGFSDNVAIFFASTPAWAVHATSYKITLAVLNVGFGLEFGFLSEIMLQYSSVL
jgi:hypothetical protein